ncbi:MAG: hypothetical protein JSS28_00485 [Proteobacteria bacterium]|nr:hypothetical protein [Pseudomonadota bacterium]
MQHPLHVVLAAGAALLTCLPAAASTVSLTVSNPYCVRSDANATRCLVRLRNASATGSDTSFQSIDIAVDGKARLRMNGFFEATAYLAQSMYGTGLIVACGLDGSGGTAGMGQAHSVTISATMYGGPTATDTANVLCPAASDVIFADGFGY